jgi:hypothetical protein
VIKTEQLKHLREVVRVIKLSIITRQEKMILETQVDGSVYKRNGDKNHKSLRNWKSVESSLWVIESKVLFFQEKKTQILIRYLCNQFFVSLFQYLKKMYIH